MHYEVPEKPGRRGSPGWNLSVNPSFPIPLIKETYRINKEDQDENKCDFHSILQFGHKSTLGDKTENLLPPGKGEGKDQEHKNAHLRQEQDKHL